MKYKHDRMLPAHAFQVRGSVIGGRSMRLHGDSDESWAQLEPEGQGYWDYQGGDAGSTWVSTPAADPITQPAPAPLAPPPAPVPSAYTPFDTNAYGSGSNQADEYAHAAELANWHMSRGDPNGYAQQFIDQANEMKEHLSQPFRIDTRTSGSYGDDGNGPSTETFLVTPDGSQSVVQDENGGYVAQISGSYGGDGGGFNTTGAGIDIPSLLAQQETAQTKPYGTGMGPAAGYAYEMNNSEGNVFRKFDAQGNLTEYLDQAGVFQPASAVKPVGTRFNAETGQLDTVYSFGPRQGDIVGNEWVPGMSVYHEDQGGWLGEGGWSRMAGLVAAGLTAGVAGGAFSGLGIGASAGSAGGLTVAQASALMGVEAGISLSGLATAVTQGALIGAATSGLQGASPADMLKSSLIGGIAAGGGSLISGAGLGSVGNVAAKTGLQTGLAAVSGGDVGQAAISGLINSVLPVALSEALPADTMSAFNSLPDPLKKLVMSTAGSVLNAGFNGTDISDAATNGVVNGIINLGKDFANGAFNSLTESDLAQTVKGYFTPSSTAGDFTGSYQDSADNSDVINSIFRQDAQDAFDRNTPSAVDNSDVINSIFRQDAQDAFDRNMPVPPPLIQTAMNQTTPEDVYNRTVDAFSNPQVGAPLSTLASAPTSDSIITLPDGTRQFIVGDDDSGPTIGQGAYNPDQDAELFVDFDGKKLPEGYRQATREESEAGLGESYFRDGFGIPIVQIGTTAASSGGSGSMSIPSLESTAAAINAFVEAGGDTSAISSSESTQSPEYAVTEAFKAFFGRNPTDIELNRFAPIDGERLAPQEYLKNVFDFAQEEKQRQSQPVFVEFAQPEPPPLVADAINRAIEQEQVKPEKAPRVKAPEGGSGTQGGSLAGDQGRVGAAAPLATASPSESAYGTTEEFQALNVDQTSAVAVESASVSTEMANLGLIDQADIPVVTANLNESSKLLNVTPTVAVTNGLVTNEGTLSDAGVTKVASETGLSEQEVKIAVQGSSTIEVGTGSGLKSEGTGAAKGTGTGVAGSSGLGGSSGTGVGGQGTGVGTGTGSGSGSGTGGLPSSGSYGGTRLTINPQFPGALPGNLEGTYLKGVDVDAYDPFANYNTYQQLAPVNAAQGGSPLQLMQLQQGIVGGDSRQYNMVQNRPAPNYFTYGADTSSNKPTTFAGSQLIGKPKPSIPVTPTGNIGANDWMYGAAGTNQLSPAGAGIAALPSGLMAGGGMAHGGLDEGEHIPEFITGETGHYVRGRGDGQSDDIPAMLADGEYVFDSSSVSTLGNGSSDAGAKLLDAFRETLREHTRAAPKDKIPPKASPLQYMQEAMKKVNMA